MALLACALVGQQEILSQLLVRIEHLFCAAFSMQGIEAAAEVMVHGYVRLMVESEELAVEMNHGITPMITTWWFHRRLSRTDKAKLPAPNGKFTTISRNVRQLALLHRRAMGLNSAGR